MTTLPKQPTSRARIAGALLVGLVMGGGVVVVVGPQQPQVNYREAARAVTPLSKAEAMPVVLEKIDPQSSASQQFTDREREVLARLASLPDLPVVQTPAFDVKIQGAPTAKTAAHKPVAAIQKTPAPTPTTGESVIARIQVVSVENGRVFYRSVDDQMHTARVGERLLGVNGRVIAIDAQGAELQIEGQRMRVAANNM